MKVSKTINNKVFVKLPIENDKIKTKSGAVIYIDTSFEQEKHTDIICEVITPPEKFDYVVGGEKRHWNTEIEIKQGDVVWTNYIMIRSNLETGAYIKEGDDIYMFIDYDTLVLAKREDEIIMLNGFCLVEPVEEDVKSNLLLNKKKKYGKIVKLANPNKEYKNKALTDNVNVKVGDIISFDKFADIPVEYGMHKTLDKEYWKIQRRNMSVVWCG